MSIPVVRSRDYEVSQFRPVRFERSVLRRVNYYPCIESLALTKNFNSFSFKIRQSASDSQLVRSIRLNLPITAKFYSQQSENGGHEDPYIAEGFHQISVLEGSGGGNNNPNIALGENILKCFKSIEVRVNGTAMSMNSDFISVLDFVHSDGLSEFGPKPSTGSAKPIASMPLNRVWENSFQSHQGVDVVLSSPQELMLGQSISHVNSSFADRNRAFLEDCVSETDDSGVYRSTYSGTLVCDLDIGLFTSRFRKNAVGELHKNSGYPYLRELYLLFVFQNLECELEQSVIPLARQFRPWSKYMFSVGSPLYYYFNKQQLSHSNSIVHIDCQWRNDPYLSLEIVEKTPELSKYQLSYPGFNLHKTDPVKVGHSDSGFSFPSMRLNFRTIQSPSLIYLYCQPTFPFRESWLQAGQFRTLYTDQLRIRVNTQSGAVFNLDSKNLYELSMQSFSNYMSYNEWIAQPVLCFNTATLGAPDMSSNDNVISQLSIECEIKATKLFKEELEAYTHAPGFFSGYPLGQTEIWLTNATIPVPYHMTVSPKQKTYVISTATESQPLVRGTPLIMNHVFECQIRAALGNLAVPGQEFGDRNELIGSINGLRRKEVEILRGDGGVAGTGRVIEHGDIVSTISDCNRRNFAVRVTGRFQVNGYAPDFNIGETMDAKIADEVNQGNHHNWGDGRASNNGVADNTGGMGVVFNGVVQFLGVGCKNRWQIAHQNGGWNNHEFQLLDPKHGTEVAWFTNTDQGVNGSTYGLLCTQVTSVVISGNDKNLGLGGGPVNSPWKIAVDRPSPNDRLRNNRGDPEWGFSLMRQGGQDHPDYQDNLSVELCCLTENSNQIALIGRNSMRESSVVLGSHFVQKDKVPLDTSNADNW